MAHNVFLMYFFDQFVQSFFAVWFIGFLTFVFACFNGVTETLQMFITLTSLPVLHPLTLHIDAFGVD